MELDSLYQEVILDHYRNPHHKGLSDNKDIQVKHNNPSCGDEVTLNLTLSDGLVKDISWDGVGCSISMASVSVMSDLLIGKNISDANLVLKNALQNAVSMATMFLTTEGIITEVDEPLKKD